MDIIKEYYVRVDTTNDGNPIAQQIRFNNDIIWTVESGTVPNSERFTNIEPNNVHMNPRTIKTNTSGILDNNDSVPRMDEIYEDKSNSSEDVINPMSSSSSSSSNIPTNKSDDATYENNPLIYGPRPPKSNMTLRNSGNSQKSTIASLGKRREKVPPFQTLTQRSTFGGRKTTRKNKKKTKTMRRKRRNL